MARSKTKKGGGRVPPKHLQSRISYLYRAALQMHKFSRPIIKTSTMLTSEEDVHRKEPRGLQEELSSHSKAGMQGTKGTSQAVDDYQAPKQSHAPNINISGQGHQFLSELRAISLKSQIRLDPELKHSICKRCHGLLIAGSTSTSEIENLSRGGKKSWADVLVVTCNVCGTKKRFPQGARRQPRRNQRSTLSKAERKPKAQDQ